MQGAANAVGARQDQTYSWHGKDARIEIAKRAYELWIAAGHPADRHLDFWLQAEAELEAARHSRSRTKPRRKLSGC